MKKQLHLILIILLYSSLQLHAQSDTARWQWMHSIGGIGPGPNTNDQDGINDFRVDRYGNSYMAGSFYNRMDIQNIQLEVPLLVTNNRDAKNGYLAKFDCEGNVEWAHKWGSANGGGVWNILPTDNYLYVSGVAATQQNYPCYISDSIISNGQFGFVGRALAKYDLNGSLLSYKIFDKNVTVAYESLLQQDNDGNLISLGYSDSAFIDGNYIERGFHIFKLDSNGNYINNVLLANQSGQNRAFNFLELDAAGNIYIGGRLDSAMTSFAGVQPDYMQGTSVSFIAKFDNNFLIQNFIQDESIKDAGVICHDIENDSNFNIYASYTAFNYKEFNNQIIAGSIFQGDTVVNYYNNLSSSVKFVILKYDSNGVKGWMKQVHSELTDENSKLDLYISKDTIVAFGLIGAGNFNIDNYNTTLASTSYMLLTLDTNGNMLDIEFFPTVSGSSQTPYGAFLSSANNYHVVGTHSNYIQFPDSTLFPLHGSGSNKDIFIAKYGVNQCFKCDSIQPAFTVAQQLGYTAQITANTTQHAASYAWDFGNGQTSTDSLPNLTINYPDTGTYTVCLTAQNYCDTQTLCKQIHIGCPPPLAQGYSYTTGNNSIDIQSMQVQQYDNYQWNFGDGNSSTDSLPNHQYNTSGTYELCLIVENTCGIDSFCQSINITCPPPSIQQANLFIDTLSIIANGVTLQNYDSVYWDFGDGNSSTQENPIHTYASTNTYTICLNAYNVCGDTTYCQQVSVVGTGIIHLASGGTVKVYPNPAENFINIELQNSEENLHVSVLDLHAKTQLKTKLRSQKEQLNISSLSQGIYFIEFKEKNQSYSVKIIKK